MVSKSTFYYHMQQREPLSQFSSEIRDFLNSKPVDPRLPVAITSRTFHWPLVGTSSVPGHYETGPRAKRMRLDDGHVSAMVPCSSVLKFIKALARASG